MVFDNRVQSVSHFEALFADYGEVLKVSDVSEVLLMPPRAIQSWLRNGDVRGFQLRRQWRFVKHDLCEDLVVLAARNDPEDDDGDDADLPD